MELDREKERRVWERVRGTQAMPPLRDDPVGRPEALVRENGAVLGRLSRQVGGKQGEKLRRLSQEQLRLANGVRGIGYLRGEPPARASAPGGKAAPGKLLGECLARCMEFHVECAHRATDPTHGPVFAQLSRQAAEQAAAMAELLGEMEPGIQ